MYKSMLAIISLLMFCIGFAFAASTAEELWWQNTASTREAAQALQAQQAQQNAQSQKFYEQQYLQQQKIQQSLDAIEAHQRAVRETVSPANITPAFQPKPRNVTGSDNPYLKKNPWGNTTKNPYAGKTYLHTKKPAIEPDSEKDAKKMKPPTNIYITPTRRPSISPVDIYQ